MFKPWASNRASSTARGGRAPCYRQNNIHPSRRGTIPAKTCEAIALGRHIFAVIPPGSDIVELLEEYGNATICNVDDIEEIQMSG